MRNMKIRLVEKSCTGALLLRWCVMSKTVTDRTEVRDVKVYRELTGAGCQWSSGTEYHVREFNQGAVGKTFDDVMADLLREGWGITEASFTESCLNSDRDHRSMSGMMGVMASTKLALDRAYADVSPTLERIRRELVGRPLVMRYGKFRGFVGFVSACYFEISDDKMEAYCLLRIPMKSDPSKSYDVEADARTWWPIDQLQEVAEDHIESLPNGRGMTARYMLDRKSEHASGGTE